jgi:CheY-like chemotaxis protein
LNRDADRRALSRAAETMTARFPDLARDARRDGMRAAMAARHILVVDDEPDIRDAIGEALADEGYVVETAANGMDALHWLRSAETIPDLVLLDMIMPQLDGRAFLDEINKLARFATLPVVVFSASQDADLPQVRGWARKPFDLDDLLALIRRVLNAGLSASPG